MELLVHIKQLLDDSLTGEEIIFTTESNLIMQDASEFEDDKFDASDISYSDDYDCSSVEDDENFSSPPDEISFEQMRAAVEYWQSGKKKLLNVDTVKRRFRFIKDRRQLYRFADIVNKGGSQALKLKQVWEHTCDLFKGSTAKHMIIHDNDLRRWALDKAREISLLNFKAKSHWPHKFKKHNRIVSRKINKMISLKMSHLMENYVVSATVFVGETKKKIAEMALTDVYNTDQSGFNYEMHSGRTLAPCGSKTVEVAVQQVNATTHSYTIQPIISASGSLLSPMLLVLQEAGGKFGPQVAKKVFRPNNIYLLASSSGKLGKAHLHEWTRKVLLPNIGEESLLLVDSWSCYNDDSLRMASEEQNKNLKIVMIPPKTTGMCQPLDRYFFRVYKN